MQNVIYNSAIPLDWDAQSAFKIKNYYTDIENHMIFCYLKQYVFDGTLKLCSYCFDSEAVGKNDIHLFLNFDPENASNYFKICFGIDGVAAFEFVCLDDDGKEKIQNLDEAKITFHSFRANDQQGFYWCAEIDIDKALIFDFFDVNLKEKSIFLLNLYKNFSQSGDYACLCIDDKNEDIKTRETMQDFVVLNY